MTRLLLTQDVFLLAHDDESGKNTASAGLSGALAAALLLDLAEQGLITVDDDDRVRATDTTPADLLLADAVAAIRDQPKPKDVGHWLYQLPRKIKPLDRRIGESLVERGILAEQPAKLLGIFSTTHWPERDPRPEQELRAELRDALLGGTEPSARVLLLSALLHQHGMVDGLVDKPDRKPARERAEAFAKQAETSDAISQAVGESVRATQAAVMTAILTSTVAASIATTSTN